MNYNIVNKLIIIDEQLKDDSFITMASEVREIDFRLESNQNKCQSLIVMNAV
jgi:hypothetical protein